MNLTDLTAAELVTLQAAGRASAVEIADAFLTAIRDRDPALRAFVQVDEAGVRRRAAAVDAKRAGGTVPGPLAGVPVAVKDLLCTRDGPTTCGSRMLRDYIPPYDADVVERVRAADAVLIGKTNLDEFAMGSSTETSSTGPTRNPWDRGRTPGGSSGGSAAAVAAGLAPVALGTDTGGSIRQPAALCGVVGLKPTYGRVSRYGLVAFASSLDQVGPFARTVADAARVLEVIAGHDPRDSTSVSRPVPRYTDSLDVPVEGLRVGVPREFFGEGLDAEVGSAVRAALKEYERRGARLVDVSLPHSPFALSAYYIVAPAEASSNLARYDGMHFGHRTDRPGDLVETVSRSRTEGFGPEVRRRILIGTYVLSSGYRDAYYVQALKVRRLIKRDFDSAFEQCDVLAGPTTPAAAFKLGEKSNDPLAMYLSDVYTVSANLAGLPGLSLPCGFTRGGLPIGLQLLAPPFAEELLLRTARMYEAATDWHTRRTPG